MKKGFYFWMGVYRKGKFICYVGNKIKADARHKDLYLLMFNKLAGELDRLYRPIGDEYIAFDYEEVI
jgi:hypothetical protein